MTRLRSSRRRFAGVALSTSSDAASRRNIFHSLGRRLVPLIAGISALALPAMAGETLDQAYVPTSSFGTFSSGVTTTVQKGQVFTVGLDGMLTRVELFGYVSSASAELLTLEIRETTGGVPVEADAPIASVPVPFSTFPRNTPAFVSVDLSSFGIAVHAGDVLAVVLRYHGTDQSLSLVLTGNGGDPYPGGTHVFRTASTDWQTNPGADVGFRTWVDTAFTHPICFGDGTASACPCGNSGASGEGCANSTGAGCVLSASGSASIAAGDLVLTATNALPNKPGMLFQGTGALQGGAGLSFGDGIRCCGGMVVRLEIVRPDPNGTVSSTIDVAAAGAVAAGDPRCYQLWYRDLPGGPCASSFNLSNALMVAWQP